MKGPMVILIRYSAKARLGKVSLMIMQTEKGNLYGEI
jgi:hypothetical protein